MSQNQGGYLAIPSFDGPSDTRSATSHRSGGSQSHHPSQVSGSHVSGSQHGSQAPFYKDEVRFLSYVVSAQGIRIEDE